MKIHLFPGDRPYDGPEGLPVTVAEIPCTRKRPLAVAAAAILATVLHGLLFLWYVNRPVPLPVSEAAPLPMIDLVLSAPPSPAGTRPMVTPPSVPPKEAKKPDPKPVKKPKPKPKPVRQESPIKQVEIQRAEPDAAPPAPPAPPAPIRDRTASPRNDVFPPASSDADYLNNPKPIYPSVARSRHWEGLVVLRVYVTAEGRCGEVSVQRSSGHEVLDESALEAVKKWRFVPAKRGDAAQASWVTVPIEFQLE